MTRTLGLFDRLRPGQLSDYLSGLLIGAELLSGARGAQEVVVIGSPALTARYCAAGDILGHGAGAGAGRLRAARATCLARPLARAPDQPIDIKLALPPAAVVFTVTARSFISQSRGQLPPC